MLMLTALTAWLSAPAAPGGTRPLGVSGQHTGEVKEGSPEPTPEATGTKQSMTLTHEPAVARPGPGEAPERIEGTAMVEPAEPKEDGTMSFLKEGGSR